jgi:hypothetical protein
MRCSIEEFQKDLIGLGSLVRKLDGLINALEMPTSSWKTSILKEWGILEDVYADLLDRGEKTISGAHAEIVSESIQRIRNLIDAGLE